MTPLQIEIMLWYRCRVGDYRDGDLSAPAVKDAVDDFVTLKMLQPRPPSLDPEHAPQKYVITDRGTVFCEALCAMPLPEARCFWSVRGVNLELNMAKESD